jgi:hypothetical protein
VPASVILLGLVLQLQPPPAKVVGPAIPMFGIVPAPKAAEVLAVERDDPVAHRCAGLGDGMARKMRGEVSDVIIQKGPRGETVWSATLVMAREPPLIPKMVCDATTFRIANDTFPVSTPPDQMA